MGGLLSLTTTAVVNYTKGLLLNMTISTLTGAFFTSLVDDNQDQAALFLIFHISFCLLLSMQIEEHELM